MPRLRANLNTSSLEPQPSAEPLYWGRRLEREGGDGVGEPWEAPHLGERRLIAGSDRQASKQANWRFVVG